MFLSRYIALVLFIVLTSLMIFKERGKLKNKIIQCGIIFTEGMVGGFIIDSVGINAGYYYFPRQPFLSLEYFAIVLPCWGVFGMAIQYCWNKSGNEKFIKGLLITTPLLFTFYEGSNLITHSWVYNTPSWAIVLGWTPLVLTFAGCHRRRVLKRKIEAEEEKARSKQKVVVANLLYIANILTTLVMFPLLLVTLARVFTDLKRGEGRLEYAKYLLMTK